MKPKTEDDYSTVCEIVLCWVQTLSGSGTSSLVSVGALTTITVWSLRVFSCLMSWYVTYEYVRNNMLRKCQKVNTTVTMFEHLEGVCSAQQSALH